MNYNYGTLKVKATPYHNVEHASEKLIKEGNNIVDVKLGTDNGDAVCIILYQEVLNEKR